GKEERKNLLRRKSPKRNVWHAPDLKACSIYLLLCESRTPLTTGSQPIFSRIHSYSYYIFAAFRPLSIFSRKARGRGSLHFSIPSRLVSRRHFDFRINYCILWIQKK